MFEGRLPAALEERAPRIVETSRGHEVWEFEGRRYTQVGMNAVVGRRPETVKLEPFRFDQKWYQRLPIASSRSASPTSQIRRLRRTRSDATPNAGSGR